ncbi:hypothetical protein SAMN04487949_2455 [Halogranum gelatinilyticum]|uniref:Uncharacterized protein n=2 Tax=Halogranum gelatinilyticum TaxID=660521 RepID=A0A1G9VPD6_9EURY|nr:hypothetical protein SAMN04487949_2455 [Halogranum gelatinilyticum]
MSHATTSRRRLLTGVGAVALGSLAGCLNRVASSVTNTAASPAAVFAGTQGESVGEFAVGEPHVSRLTPTLAERVEMEGWVTSSPLFAQNHNSSRSNRHSLRGSDEDSDDDGVADADEDDELVAYLDGNPMVAERFTVCLPDAAVPGGNGSIREAVTPERLVAYLTGKSSGEGRVYSWGTPKAGQDGGGDCDDNDPEVFPGAVCGTTPHFVAEVTGPVSTGGSLEAIRAEDGSVLVVSSPPGSGRGSEQVCSVQWPFELERCGSGGWARTTEVGSSTGVSVFQVMVQPPRCPKSFPALLYVQRCESNDQLVYTGGWVIDDAALYENSVTVVSIAGPTSVVPVGGGDLDGDGLEDVVKRSSSGERALRGARIDSGTVEEFVERGVDGLAEDIIDVITSRGGETRVDDGVNGENHRFVTHVSVDAPVLHLTSASRASQDVKFKAGAELSKAVN